jgi:hypothetical protein
MTMFRRHFERCALRSFEKREKLLSLVGEHFLQLDLDEGIARFDDRIALPFQVLGTESENTLTWLWAWAEEQTEVPDRLLDASRDLRTWLEREGLNDLVRPSVDLDLADGAMFAAVAAEVCHAGAFYREHYEGGALFILLFSSEIDGQPDLDRSGLVRILGDLIAQYELDHRNLLLSYLRAKNLPFSESAETVNAQLASGERVIAEFLPGGAIARINGEPLP